VPIKPFAGRIAVPNIEPALSKAVFQGLQQKQTIINQVIDGRLPLEEAAGRFQAAHQAAGMCLEKATGVPNRSIDNENVCRTIIGWVYLALSDRPEHADRISEKLEVELREMLKKNPPAGVTTR
jgi:hypothetical protein